MTFEHLSCALRSVFALVLSVSGKTLLNLECETMDAEKTERAVADRCHARGCGKFQSKNTSTSSKLRIAEFVTSSASKDGGCTIEAEPWFSGLGCNHIMRQQT